MHTDSKPVRGDNMALFLQLQIHSHPEWYATLVRGAQWPVCTLGIVYQNKLRGGRRSFNRNESRFLHCDQWDYLNQVLRCNQFQFRRVDGHP